MKRITRNNYEAFLLDLSEGRLSPELAEELFDFLSDNSDLEADLEEMDTTPVLLTSHVPNRRKNTLYKEESEENLLNLIISVTENVAQPNEEKQLSVMIEKNEQCRDEYKLMRSIALKPGAEEFSRKALLMQEAPVRVMPWLLRFSGVAAAVLFMWTFFRSDNPSLYSSERMAYVNEGGVSTRDVGGQFVAEELPDVGSEKLLNEEIVIGDGGKNTPQNSINSGEEKMVWLADNTLDNARTNYMEDAALPRLKQVDNITLDQHLNTDVIALQTETLQQEKTPADISEEPSYITAMSEEQEDLKSSSLVNKVTIKIDESVELKRENDAFYVRIGRFTVSFVKSIFSKNNKDDDENKKENKKK